MAKEYDGWEWPKQAKTAATYYDYLICQFGLGLLDCVHSRLNPNIIGVHNR